MAMMIKTNDNNNMSRLTSLFEKLSNQTDDEKKEKVINEINSITLQ